MLEIKRENKMKLLIKILGWRLIWAIAAIILYFQNETSNLKPKLVWTSFLLMELPKNLDKKNVIVFVKANSWINFLNVVETHQLEYEG